MQQLDTKALRKAFGAFMTGVTVVTALDENGNPVGFTANSFTSVSLDPPLLLVCPAKSLSSFDVFKNCQRFAVNILSEDQQDISNLFASFKGDRFSQVDWHPDHQGVPLINGAITAFSCQLAEGIDAGDHQILLGQIDAVESNEGLGLGYSSQGYFSLGRERDALQQNKEARYHRLGALVASGDKVLLENKDDLWDLPTIERPQRTGATIALSEHLKSHQLNVSFGPTYSVFENAKHEHFAYFLGKSESLEETTPSGQFIAINQLSSLNFKQNSVKTMLERYALEYQNGVFGLYLGDDVSGDIHPLSIGVQS